MSLSGLLNQSITVENPTGSRDLHGKPALGAAATVQCRFERKYRTIVTAGREQEPIHAVAVVGPTADVEIGAAVTFGSDKYRVLERADAPGRNGSIHHYELMLQLWSFA